MKKRLNLFNALTFAVALLLSFTLHNDAQAKFSEVALKGPTLEKCKDTNGTVYAYATDCSGEGDPCVDSTCPKVPS